MADTSISSKQYWLLCAINRNPHINTTAFTGTKKQDFDFLLKKKYVEPIKKRRPIDTPNGSRHILQTVGYRTTSEGRAAKYSFLSTFYKWWIPVIISIIALIVSIVFKN